jgi:hypothetical protein
MGENDDGGMTALVMSCAFAILAGQKTVTISTKTKPPKGFPRCELLSVGSNGSRNYSVCPIKALTWIHNARKAATFTLEWPSP